jgi:hypothetical protein
MPSAPGKKLFTIEGATYGGFAAIGAAIAYRFNENTAANLGVSFGGAVAVRGGVSIEW